MAVTGVGILSQPLEKIAELIANVGAFQAWVDADDASEAKESIFLCGLESGESARPFVAVHLHEFKSVAIGGGGGSTFSDTGSAMLVFENTIDETNSESIQDAFLSFLNDVGAVINGMKNLSNVNAYLPIRSISKHSGPSCASDAEANVSENYIQIAFILEW